MNNLEAVEYAVFHWVFGESFGLPGISENGLLEQSFFDEKSTEKNNHYEKFAQIFETLKDLPSLRDEKALLLCSGGVDSSLLALIRKENIGNSRQAFLHTSYAEHDNNDLYKFQNILQACPSKSFISTINSAAYMEGIDFLSERHFFQNSFGPTLAMGLQSIPENKYEIFITGSGPDELFYGMEKYSWDEFENLEQISIEDALGRLDPRYNEEVYLRLFNKDGNELYKSVLNKRALLYKNIAGLKMNIFDSQRLLAYSTVTVQHMQLFNTIGKFFGLSHSTPFLEETLVKASLNTPLKKLVDIGENKQVEIGKKYLKKYLCEYINQEHVYGRKIGFHAPTQKYLHSFGSDFFVENADFIPTWLDKDLTIKEINTRFDEPNSTKDYFLYSLYNILKMYKGETVNEN